MWNSIGEAANVAQLTGLDAVRLISLIVGAAATAKMHKKNCRQFAQHLKLIANLLDQLKLSDLKMYPGTREPLDLLEDALRRSYLLVHSCQDRSFLYLLAMGWNIVYQFRKAQNEIDRYLRLIPLITLVDNARVREKLECIEHHQCEYTLDEEDRRLHDIILKAESTRDQASLLRKTLSCSYPNMGFDEALQKENEKLRLELQRSQSNYDVTQCQVIQRLIEVTETVAASSLPEESSPIRLSKQLEHSYSDVAEEEKRYSYAEEESYPNKIDSRTTSRKTSSASSTHDLLSRRGSLQPEHFHTDLLDCCSEPCLCLQTLFCPCITFSQIATVAYNRPVSKAEACHDLMAHTLILSCCCYTCCVRGKLRKMLNIKGGCIDDFLSHLMCCCCSLVQEWREVEIRGIPGAGKTKTTPPPLQFMES